MRERERKRERELELDNFNTQGFHLDQPVLAILLTQINMTIPQTNLISTIKQLINAVS